MTSAPKSRYRIACILFATALFLLGGCASSTMQTSSDMTSDLLPTMSNMVGRYGDIELPVEMKWNTDKSMAIRTDSFQGGILHYSGSVDVSSLKDFIITSMENNKWKLVGEAQYKNVLLAFTKPNKTCMAVIDEGVGGSFGKTNVTLYVTVDVAAASRLNPFGEPIVQ